MIASASIYQLQDELCQAMGLDASRVKSITLHFAAMAMPTAEVTLLVINEGEVIEVLKRFKWAAEGVPD